MSVDLQEPKPALPDQADRDAARKRLESNIAVTAGAGTGKTALLIDRALFTLLGKGVPAQSLVALTFTEKAAGEIRVRLADRLSQLTVRLENGNGGNGHVEGKWSSRAFLAELQSDFGIGPAKAEALAKIALENMDQAPIGTLHSFAAQILRAYPLEAGMDPGFQVDEGDLWEELFNSEWAAWLDRELGERAPREREWLDILRLCPLEDLETLAAALCQARIDLNSLDIEPGGMRAWMKETAGILESEGKRQPQAKGKIEEQLGEIGARLRRLAAKRPPELPARLPSSKLPNCSWPSSWDDRELERWKAAKRLCESCSPEVEALFYRARTLLLPFAEHFRRRYAWRGLISFDGLLLAARNLVRDNRNIREELKSRYLAFLVDEFQDTDPLQGELLMYLAEKPGQAASKWSDVRLEPGKLFVVGDPKQSIYRFRGADIASYERFVRHVLDQSDPGLSCELRSNFRSQAGIINCVNAAFEKIMRPAPGTQSAYRPIQAVSSSSRKGDGDHGFVETVVIQGAHPDDNPPVARVRRSEAEWVAHWIEANRRRYRYKDIALLFRSTTPLGEYLEIFKNRGIPYVVEGEKYFYGTQEVQDFLNLLRALDDPGDKIALAGVLRSPIVAMTDEELRRLAVADGLNYLQDPAEPRLKRFFKILRDIRALVGRKPLGELLETVFDKTQVLELVSSAYHDQQTLANLLKLGRLAADAAEGQGETLKGFIHRVSRFIAEAREEGESPLSDEHLDAVRVLTIHKSKGLEYPVVILPNLSGKISGGREGKTFRVEEGSGAAGFRMPKTGDSAAIVYLEEAERRRERDEQIRLLYVAFTRAKERLILLGSNKPESQSLAGLLQKEGLWPSLGPGTSKLDLPLGAALGFVESGHRARTAAVPVDIQAAAASWLMRIAERDQLESLTRFVNPSSRRPSASPKDVEVSGKGMQQGVELRGDLVGRICHKALERWDFTSDIIREAARARKDLSGEASTKALNAAAEESEKILVKFAKSSLAKELGDSEILGREVPFIFGDRGQTVRGVIDLVCRRGDRLCVIDYKTDSVEPQNLPKKAKIYETQMRLYAEAVARAWEVPEVSCSLVFVRLARAVDRIFKR